MMLSPISMISLGIQTGTATIKGEGKSVSMKIYMTLYNVG